MDAREETKKIFGKTTGKGTRGLENQLKPQTIKSRKKPNQRQ